MLPKKAVRRRNETICLAKIHNHPTIIRSAALVAPSAPPLSVLTRNHPAAFRTNVHRILDQTRKSCMSTDRSTKKVLSSTDRFLLFIRLLTIADGKRCPSIRRLQPKNSLMKFSWMCNLDSKATLSCYLSSAESSDVPFVTTFCLPLAVF